MRWFYLLLVLLAYQLSWAIDPQNFDSPAQEARYQALIEELRCLKCQNQNLADSNASLAGDLRDEVLRLMKAGNSDDQIKTFLTDRYGDFVLYRPPLKPGTWALWYGPFALLLAGAIVVIVTLRRRGRADPAATADPEQDELDRRLAALESEVE